MYILDKLWREGLSPSERYIRKNSEYDKIRQMLCDQEEGVCAELTEKGKSLFKDYHQAEIDLAIVSEREVFIEAFRMGARFILDIIGEYRGSFREATEE